RTSRPPPSPRDVDRAAVVAVRRDLVPIRRFDQVGGARRRGAGADDVIAFTEPERGALVEVRRRAAGWCVSGGSNQDRSLIVGIVKGVVDRVDGSRVSRIELIELEGDAEVDDV